MRNDQPSPIRRLSCRPVARSARRPQGPVERERTFDTSGRETAITIACAVWMMPSAECSLNELVANETYWYTVVCGARSKEQVGADKAEEEGGKNARCRER